MKRIVFALPVLALALGGTNACATKKMVKTQVGEVNGKVETLSKTVEETQERTRTNEGKITEVDQRAQAAGQRADAANKSATEARAAAAAVNTRADEIERASKRLVYEVTLSEDQGNFKFGHTDLPDTAKARIDEVINQLKADPKGVFIEIEGHTDNVGSKEVNERIGMDRAEAVKRYIYESHQVPLHKINVISYGEEKPVAPNKTRDGRAQNRRVVIRVLS
jgi:outer membrane protein OmpA-like peptidoglycan-associated protein